RMPCARLSCHFLVPCAVHLAHLHSFPTRRSSDLVLVRLPLRIDGADAHCPGGADQRVPARQGDGGAGDARQPEPPHHSRGRGQRDRKSTRLNSSHVKISYAVFCLKKKTTRRRKER